MKGDRRMPNRVSSMCWKQAVHHLQVFAHSSPILDLPRTGHYWISKDTGDERLLTFVLSLEKVAPFSLYSQLHCYFLKKQDTVYSIGEQCFCFSFPCLVFFYFFILFLTGFKIPLNSVRRKLPAKPNLKARTSVFCCCHCFYTNSLPEICQFKT